MPLWRDVMNKLEIKVSQYNPNYAGYENEGNLPDIQYEWKL